MQINEYQQLAARTINNGLSTDQLIQNAALGLAGEAGEVADIVKKVYYQGHVLEVNKLIDEAGDIAWYLAELCTALGINMERIFEHNIDKLKKRYPAGFEVERSVNRVE